MQVPQFFADLFRKYLDNRCSPEEAEYFLSLINSDEYRAYATAMIDRQISGATGEQTPDLDLRARLDQRLKLILEEDSLAALPPAPVRHLRPWRWMAAACVLAITFAAGYYLLRPTSPKLVAGTPAHLPVTPSVEYTRYLTLPDGSTVVLHAGSTLDFPSAFTGEKREVVLSGEAYFDIAHDAVRPFIIHTGTVTTTVLGTAFNIKADEKQVVVSVTRGKVKVENGSKVLAVLAQNEQVKFDMPQEKTIQQKVNANTIVTDWTKEDMVFNGISFVEIAELLSKRYGVNVQIGNDAMKDCKVRASFSGTEKLEYVASILCGIRNGVYEQLNDGTIVLNGEGCDVKQ